MALGTAISQSSGFTVVFLKILTQTIRFRRLAAPIYVSPASYLLTPHSSFRVPSPLPHLQHKRLLETIPDGRLLQGEPAEKTSTSFYKDLVLQVIEEGSQTKMLRPPPEVSVENFFSRAKMIAVIVDLLNKGASDEELQRAFGELAVTLDTLLVTQILRGDLPCDIALNFFHWLECQPGFKHNEYTYGVMLNNLGRAGRLHDMQQLFDQMKAEGCKVTRLTLVNVMGWFFKARDMQSVAHHWTTLRRSGTKPSAAIYTAYIEYLIATNRHSQVPKIFEEMLRLNCLPNSRTYSLFIEHLVNAGNVEAGARIIKLMHNMKVIPSRVAYRIMINGFARMGNVERVLEMLREMREHFYRPTKHLMAAVKALQAAGKFEEVSSLLGEIVPDTSQNGGSDMKLCEDEEDMDAVDDADSVTVVWRSAACSHLVFDISSFVDALYAWNQNVERVLEQENLQWESTLVLGVFRRLKNLESFWPFFHWLSSKTRFKHDSYSCALLVHQILKSALTSDKLDYVVSELFKSLIQDGIKLSIPLFNVVIRHYVGVDKIEKAGNMLELLKDIGLKPNEFTYASLIQGFAKRGQGKKATEMMKEMEERGFSLDRNTCAELITCFGLAGKTERAFALFCKVSKLGRVSEFGGEPAYPEYKAMLANFFNAGENERALKLYEDMKKAGIAPTQDMYDVVTKILHKAHRLSEIQDLAQERAMFKFFDGKKKALQESLLEALFTFMKGLRQRES